jgi:hypothetical protein
MVIGRHLAEHLVALVRAGCRSATGVDPSSLTLRRERANVVWLAGLDEVTPLVESALAKMDAARLVAIELAETISLTRLKPLMRKLRDLGLVSQAFHHVAGRVVVTAQKPDLVRQAA